MQDLIACFIGFAPEQGIKTFFPMIQVEKRQMEFRTAPRLSLHMIIYHFMLDLTYGEVYPGLHGM